MRQPTQQGFTLIELIVVIVIMGILASFAVPKFMGVEREARIASVNALAGSLKSSAAMAHGLWLAQNGPASITVEGNTINFASQYPTNVTIGYTQQDLTGFTPNPNTTGTFTRTGATATATCKVVYTNATTTTVAGVATITPPTIVATTTGC